VGGCPLLDHPLPLLDDISGSESPLPYNVRRNKDILMAQACEKLYSEFVLYLLPR